MLKDGVARQDGCQARLGDVERRSGQTRRLPSALHVPCTVAVSSCYLPLADNSVHTLIDQPLTTHVQHQLNAVTFGRLLAAVFIIKIRRIVRG